MGNIRNRSIHIDYLRCIALILIIIHHCSNTVTKSIYYHYIEQSLTMIEKIGVPIFLIISGYLLLPLKTSMRDFFTRRMQRVIFPFLFFCYFYSYIHIFIIKNIEINLITLAFPFIRLSEHHLWYMYMLLGIYIIAPFLSDFLNNRKIKEISFYVIAWLVTMLLMWFIPSDVNFGLYKNFIGIEYPFYILYYISGYVGYFFIGGWLKKIFNTDDLLIKQTYERYKLSIILVLFFLYVALTAIGLFYLQIPFGYVNTYMTLPCVVLSLAVFVSIKELDGRVVVHNKINLLVTELSKKCFGIYLIHVFIIYMIEFFIKHFNVTEYYNKILFGFTVLVLSYIVVKLLSKMPYSKYIVGD